MPNKKELTQAFNVIRSCGLGIELRVDTRSVRDMAGRDIPIAYEVVFECRGLVAPDSVSSILECCNEIVVNEPAERQTQRKLLPLKRNFNFE